MLPPPMKSKAVSVSPTAEGSRVTASDEEVAEHAQDHSARRVAVHASPWMAARTTGERPSRSISSV